MRRLPVQERPDWVATATRFGFRYSEKYWDESAMFALTLQQARYGLPALPTMAVYALTVGFGLEFLGSAWRGR